MAHNPKLTPEEAGALARKGYENPPWFCRTFLPSWFPGPIPWVHRGILAILLNRPGFLIIFDEDYGPRELAKILSHFVYRENSADPSSPEHPIFELEGTVEAPTNIKMFVAENTLIMMPRGFSKTTLANAVNIINILYGDIDFNLYVSETAGHATRQLRNITAELTQNSRILSVFGTLQPERSDNRRWSESDGEIQTTTDIYQVARGRGGQVRGLLINAKRPDQIIFDDLEDKESVQTPEQRQKAREWFFGDLMQVLPRVKKDKRVIGLGTLLHQDALLTYLVTDPNWTVVKFGAIDRDGEALWPAAMSLKEIARQKESYAQKGLLHIFYLELFNEIRSPETQKFKKEFFVYEFVMADTLPMKAVVIDPAISDKPDSDFCGLACGGRREDGRIQILEATIKRGMSPREQINRYFDLISKYNLTAGDAYGVEAQAYQAALVHFMQEEMFRRHVYFEITPLTHSQRKVERVEGILQGRYANRVIVHQYEFVEIETQFLDWPMGKKDGPDTLAMLVALLDGTEAYTASSDPGEDSYEPLSQVFGGDWRRHR